MPNIDSDTVGSFGEEWSRFDQSEVDSAESRQIFESYFGIFPMEVLTPEAVGFDAGCGSGRWAAFVAPHVRQLICVDASPKAIEVAKGNLASMGNCTFELSDIDAMQIEDGSMDFGYSLGVLHHMPDTGRALTACVRKLRPGAPFLVYLYYAFDNRPAWFRALWYLSDIARRSVSRWPQRAKEAAAETVAILVYLPLARAAKVAERFGAEVASFPLSIYRNRSLYIMRNDALDRFGTRLEQRFTRDQILSMMEEAGLRDVEFSPSAPHWCAVGVKI